jgi:hypothetical protein
MAGNGLNSRKIQQLKMPPKVQQISSRRRVVKSKPEVSKVTLKSNINETLSDDFFKKCNADEGLVMIFYIKITPTKH